MRRKKHKHLKRSFRRLFPSRSIIVISEETVDHYPLGGMFQLGLLVAIVALFSWISYSTGNYMAARTVLQDKERKIITTSMENKRIGEEYSLLKKDLLKLKESKEDLTEFDHFILDQYAEDDDAHQTDVDYFSIDSVKLQYKNDGEQGKDKLFERIAFLEQRIEALKSEKTEFIAAVRATTDGKISELEKLIAGTGLNLEVLKRIARLERDREERLVKDRAMEQNDSGLGNQGGPYIPENIDYWQAQEETLFDKLDDLMVLHRISDALPLSKPIPGARFTSGYGRRVDPFNKRWAMHAGVDYVGAFRTKVYATNNGRVKIAGRKGAYGNLVEIEHGLGITTRYGHLDKVLVKPGQKVFKGQAIGLQGNTGRSTGTHLHYEVRYKNKPLNPKNFIRADYHVLKK